MIGRLAWDSDRFGYEVGMVKIDAKFDLDKFMEESQAFQLIYIFSKSELTNLPARVKKVDVRITLEKPPSSIKTTQEHGIYGQVISLESMGDNSMNISAHNFRQEFLDLALISGGCSRFKTDERLGNKEYEKLYHSWAEDALLKNDLGFVFMCEDKVQGMITLASKGDGTSRIGLLAVLRDCRNKGIGSLLLKKACIVAGESGSQSLLVTTQKANIGAMSLYQKEGFRIIDEQNVYHWWRG